MKEECLICKAPLEYLNEDVLMECAICHILCQETINQIHNILCRKKPVLCFFNFNTQDIIFITGNSINILLDSANHMLSEAFIKQLHAVLKSGTSDSRLDWFAVGNYKKLPNEVGGMDTTAPENVGAEMKKLLAEYNAIEGKTFDDLLDFHYRFERIHPFQDGNGRVGRLLLFKECLRNSIVPFIIEDDIKMFYYRGLKEWQNERGYLRDTCLSAQDRFKKYLDYFRVPYDK